MLFQKLTATEVKSAAGFASRAQSPYVPFLAGLRIGEGGRAKVADEGVSRIQVKNRLMAGAKDVGLKIAFVRSGADEVVFQVVARGSNTASD